MKPFENETELGAALRELRTVPEPEFSAALDARAAAGFPRDSRWGAAVARVRERLASTPPRRLIAPAGAFAVAAIVIATAVVATQNETSNRGSEYPGLQATLQNRLREARTDDAQPATPAPPEEFEAGAAGAGASGGSGEIQRSSVMPTAKATAEGTSATEYQGAPLSSGPYAADAGRREIERSADVVLGAAPEDVRGDAAKVFDAVHAADGIVLSSSIRDGDAGEAGADFELLIPSAKVGDALAAFSAIGEVRSRHEATQDITAPTVRVSEKLQDSRATIEGLLGQLADADTDAERAAVEARLRTERYRAAALRSQLSSLSRRANLSRVSLRIETGKASSSSDDGGSGAWGVGDGIDGAGRILAVAAGVTVIGLAILAPFALIALIAWLSRRAWIRRARARALA